MSKGQAQTVGCQSGKSKYTGENYSRGYQTSPPKKNQTQDVREGCRKEDQKLKKKV